MSTDNEVVFFFFSSRQVAGKAAAAPTDDAGQTIPRQLLVVEDKVAKETQQKALESMAAYSIGLLLLAMILFVGIVKCRASAAPAAAELRSTRD